MTLISASPARSPRSLSLAAMALATGAALTLSACSGSPAGSDDTHSAGLKVVATTTQLADFVAEIGGNDVALTGLLTAGASAHHFDPTPADLLALGQADVLVVNGAGLETFIDSAVESSGFKGVVIDASEGIDEAEAKLITSESEDSAHAGEADHDHGTADHDHAHDHAHAEEDHAGHDHGDINPHIWTSPRFAEGMVAEITAGLEKADPAHAKDFNKRADAYLAKLQDLDTWIAAQFERVPVADRVIVSGHDSLSYYLHDYGIEFAGAILPSFEDNAEPSAADIDALVQSIKERGVKAIFVESSMSPKLAQAISQEAGVKVVDAESLYADSLGVAGSGADTYIDATIHNTQLILESWGVKPDELPATLQR
ncbi:zinc ABC transporter substrate-binding protein [Leucobacter insecticola]|uniref:Zinc ABC transporter substrate-binding protein n=1 Tax=Leucobacter insecticola TaxID=2714934 RepID=A0A6G8FGZ7_9MICO|nr:metal ABC transporter substrate-binding protein [Leucobacter insecticola]QIM15627.1 zinc ABC transporter substrate-binding protein [Leucobacter insecticola]